MQARLSSYELQSIFPRIYWTWLPYSGLYEELYYTTRGAPLSTVKGPLVRPRLTVAHPLQRFVGKVVEGLTAVNGGTVANLEVLLDDGES